MVVLILVVLLILVLILILVLVVVLVVVLILVVVHNNLSCGKNLHYCRPQYDYLQKNMRLCVSQAYILTQLLRLMRSSYGEPTQRRLSNKRS